MHVLGGPDLRWTSCVLVVKYLCWRAPLHDMRFTGSYCSISFSCRCDMYYHNDRASVVGIHTRAMPLSSSLGWLLKFAYDCWRKLCSDLSMCWYLACDL